MKSSGKKTLKQKITEAAAAGGDAERKTPKSEYRPEQRVRIQRPRPAPPPPPEQLKEPLTYSPFTNLKTSSTRGTV